MDRSPAVTRVLTVVNELREMSDPASAPRRITLLRRATAFAAAEHEVVLSAALNGMLAGELLRGTDGGQTEVVEEAITCLERALAVLTRGGSPEAWAMAQHHLGLAYTRRVAGNRADNLERAIECYEAALAVSPPQVPPEEWARIQFELGGIFCDRLLGDPATNLERAVSCYEDATANIDSADSPEHWAAIQHNLGLTYSKVSRLSLARRPESLERAIRCFRSALSTRPEGTNRDGRMSTLHELGEAYSQRVVGDRAENMERAIGYYSTAQSMVDRRQNPVDWAFEQRSLAGAYYNRIRETVP